MTLLRSNPTDGIPSRPLCRCYRKQLWEFRFGRLHFHNYKQAESTARVTVKVAIRRLPWQRAGGASRKSSFVDRWVNLLGDNVDMAAGPTCVEFSLTCSGNCARELPLRTWIPITFIPSIYKAPILVFTITQIPLNDSETRTRSTNGTSGYLKFLLHQGYTAFCPYSCFGNHQMVYGNQKSHENYRLLP